MRALVQRVTAGRVEIDGECVGKIERGLVILLGVTHQDTPEDVRFLVEKCVNLRIFEDDAGKMNRSLLDIGGEALIGNHVGLVALRTDRMVVRYRRRRVGAVAAERLPFLRPGG